MDLLSPMVEEIHVRGFGFWQLHHRLRWPFIAPMLPQAVLTGLGHIEKGTSVLQIAGIFSLTFSGAILFSWLAVQQMTVALAAVITMWWQAQRKLPGASGDVPLNGKFRGPRI